MGLLDAEIAKRPQLATLGVYSARMYGERLDREGKSREAIEHVARAAERLADNPYAVYLQIELGELLRDQHELADAMLALREARDKIEALRAKGGGGVEKSRLNFFDARVNAELGSAAGQLGMVDVAEPRLQEALDIAETLAPELRAGTWGSTLVYRLNLAFDYRLEDGTELRRLYEQYPLRDSISRDTTAQIQVRLAMIDVQRAFLGELPAGAGADELAATITPELKIDERIKARLFLATSHLDSGAPEDAREQIDIARSELQGRDGQEPMRLFEAGVRSRYLRESAASAEERERFLADVLRPAIRERLELMRRWPLEDAGVAPLALDPIAAAFEELIADEVELDAEHGAERALQWLVELHAAGTFARGIGIEAPDLDEIRATLLGTRPGGSDRKALLVWVPGRVHTQLFAITRDTIAVHRLAGTMTLQPIARRLDTELLSALHTNDARSDERLAAAIEAASRAFLPDELAEQLDSAEALALVGLDAFGYVPFEALPAPRERAAGWKGAGPGRWKRVLGCTHEVAYLPSLPVGVWLARRAEAFSSEAGEELFFAPRGGRPGYPAFALGPSDIGLSAFGAGAVGVDTVEGLDAALGRAELVYLFCHGEYDERRLRPAGLLVDPREGEAPWFAEDVELRTWPAAVLVSACGGARARLRRGDDGAGKLLAAFYRGGSLVAAMATMPLEESAAAELGRLASAELAGGRSIGEAFLAARRSSDPAAFGVHPIHSQLWHVWGASDLRIARSSLGPAQGGFGRSRFVGTLAVGAVLAFAAFAVLRARRRARIGA